MKNRKLIITVVVIAVVITAFILLRPKTETMQGPGKAGAKPPATETDVYIIQRADLKEELHITGSILPNESVEIRPEISQRIVGIYFNEGQKVRRGTLLVKLNDAELVAQMKKLNLNIQLATDEEKRQKHLLEIQGISQEEYDRYLNTLNTLQAEKEYLQLQIDKTSIVAPFDGTLGLRQISNGSYVSPATLITVLHQTDPVKLEFSVPERYALQVKNGSKINFKIASFDQDFTATIYAIEPSVDIDSRSVKIRATTNNTGGKLIPGGFAEITLSVSNDPNSIIVPTEAIIPDLNKQKVYVYRNGLARQVQVKTGGRTERMVKITEGLSTGDTILVTGILLVKDSTQVKIKDYKQY